MFVKKSKYDELKKQAIQLEVNLEEKTEELEALKAQNMIDIDRGCEKGEWCKTCKHATYTSKGWVGLDVMACDYNPPCKNHVKKEKKQ